MKLDKITFGLRDVIAVNIPKNWDEEKRNSATFLVLETFGADAKLLISESTADELAITILARENGDA